MKPSVYVRMARTMMKIIKRARIPSYLHKHENLQVYKTRGWYRKMMKFDFDWDLYHQRSKVETIFSVVKRVFGGDVMSRGIVTQNREITFRMISYNLYRITRDCMLIYGWFLQGYAKIFNIKITQ